ncbi:putative endonuclease [Escherichia coli VL2874]|nr:putative endonuclease [Escherichia coli VL2874]
MDNNMRKYILLGLFIFSWSVLSADVHGQIYAPDGMNVN